MALLLTRWGFHDSIAPASWCMALPVRSRSESSSISARGSASTTKDGLARSFKPHNLHLTLMGLMLIFTGFYAFYAACLVIQSTALPGLAGSI